MPFTLYPLPFTLTSKRSLLIALCSGVLMGLAPAPFNAWYLAWVALAPLWFLIRSQKSLQQIAVISLAWGIGYHGLALFWITGVHPMTWMGVPWLASLLIAIFCWVFITLWGSGVVVVWGIIVGIIDRQIKRKQKLNCLDSDSDFKQISLNHLPSAFCPLPSAFLILLAAALWSGIETLWSHSPLWWTAIAYTQSPSNLVILQLNKLSGVNTVAIVILIVNLCLGEACLRWQANNSKRSRLLFILPIVILIASHLGGYYLYQVPIAKDNLEPIKVGIVQGNIPNAIKLYSSGWRKAIAGYTSGYQRLAKQGVDVVLTPETALPFYWENILDNSSFYQAVIKEKVPAWVGANGRQGSSYTNSIFTITDEGKTYSRYDKYKLVPLGEYIPFESIVGKIIDRLSPLEAHLAAGNKDQIFNTPFGKAIIAICYESAFPHHFRRQTKAGGEFIITASNNAHYSDTMPTQHHAQDVMRAIESDRWAARATNTGYSAIVDPHGNTLWISEINNYAIHADTIYRRQNQTLYVRWGDWLTPTLLIISGILFAVRTVRSV